MRISRSGDYIAQIRLISGRVFERMLAESGVDAFNGPQGKILDALWQEDGLPVSGISEKTGLAGSTLTSMLDRMESAGLVVRTRSREDRRVVRVTLGPNAGACREAYARISEEMTRITFEGFTDEEITGFEHCLLRVLTNMKNADRGGSNRAKDETTIGEEKTV